MMMASGSRPPSVSAAVVVKSCVAPDVAAAKVRTRVITLGSATAPVSLALRGGRGIRVYQVALGEAEPVFCFLDGVVSGFRQFQNLFERLERERSLLLRLEPRL